MGQAKLRGTEEERIQQGIAKQELIAWRVNELLDKEYEKMKANAKAKNMRFSITKSELVNRMRSI